MLFGAHVSIAGGIFNAPLYGKEIGCDVIQIFTKNQIQWKIPFLQAEDIKHFQENRLKTGVIPVTVHSSYLVNIAGPDDNVTEKSINDLACELERTEVLNIPFVVFHPGAHKGIGEKYALKSIAENINKIFSKSNSKSTFLLLETTAGEGTTMGYKFEHFAEIFNKLKDLSRIGVCIDTCHIFAAGYDFRDEKSYYETIEKFDKIVGLKFLKVFHLNDSKFPSGSKMDRHEEIGSGEIGLNGFRILVKDERFKDMPGILEVPGDITGYKRNVNILRSLTNGNN
jgi:deoxyribonuclease-4